MPELDKFRIKIFIMFESKANNLLYILMTLKRAFHETTLSKL